MLTIRIGALAALAHPHFRNLWFGLLASNVGIWMQQFGLGWLVVELAVRDGTPSLGPLYLGLVGLARAVPGVVFGLIAGALADRTDRRRLLVVTQSASGAVAAILAALTIVDHINIAAILVLTALSGVFFAFDSPSRMALVPHLVPRQAVPSAASLNVVAANLATLVGPLVGGILIVPLGIGGMMAVNAVSRLGVVAVLLTLPAMTRITDRPQEGLLRSVREGFSYIWGEPAIRTLLGLLCVAGLLARPYQQLLPAVAHDILQVGAVELSWLLTATGVGGIVGSLAASSFGGLKRRRGVAIAVAGCVLGITVAAFGEQRLLLPALALAMVAQFCAALMVSLLLIVVQLRTPDHLRGRAIGVLTMSLQTLNPLGGTVVGFIGTAAGLDVALISGGLAVSAASAFVLLRVRAVRELGASPTAVPAAVPRF